MDNAIFEKDKSAGRIAEIIFIENLRRATIDAGAIIDVSGQREFYALGIDFLLTGGLGATVDRIRETVDVKAHLWRSFDKRSQDLLFEVHHHACEVVAPSMPYCRARDRERIILIGEMGSVWGWTTRSVELVRQGRFAFRRIVWVDTNRAAEREDVWFASIRVDDSFASFWDARPWEEFGLTLNRPTVRRGRIANRSSFTVIPIESLKRKGIAVTEGRFFVPDAIKIQGDSVQAEISKLRIPDNLERYYRKREDTDGGQLTLPGIE